MSSLPSGYKNYIKYLWCLVQYLRHQACTGVIYWRLMKTRRLDFHQREMSLAIELALHIPCGHTQQRQTWIGEGVRQGENWRSKLCK